MLWASMLIQIDGWNNRSANVELFPEKPFENRWKWSICRLKISVPLKCVPSTVPLLHFSNQFIFVCRVIVSRPAKMWNSLFSNGDSKRVKNLHQNLQKRVSGLFESKTAPKDCSPVLKELQNQKNKVKRLSSVYEDNIAAYNSNELNTSLMMRQKAMSLPTLANKLSAIGEAPDSPPVFMSQPFFGVNQEHPNVQRSIKYFIECDKEYIKLMDLLIKSYVLKFENIPALRLKNNRVVTDRQKEELFGPIKRIHDFHREVFQKKLRDCDLDVVRFAETLSELCTEGWFNQYIWYALDEKVINGSIPLSNFIPIELSL